MQTYEGKDVTVTFDGQRCIHSRRCVMGEPGVFQAGVKGAWIFPDNATAEDLVRIACSCPSGAITVTRKDGGEGEPVPRANTVTVRENGPLAFLAELTIEGQGGEMKRATLCRCGLSKNKPYCDNSHIEGGFDATGEPAARESQLAITDLVGPVVVTPTENGPLMVVGKIEIESGTGRNVNRVGKAFLCRCGHSANKPYCDGSHKRVGFEAPAG
ncbi:MAG: CDGSH iron-sulfur domain-containing protein [Proteobacteria bacterium]|nr:CDGSH iron-sulfur domain-containing protein [Pseudomonadota bacterium]